MTEEVTRLTTEFSNLGEQKRQVMCEVIVLQREIRQLDVQMRLVNDQLIAAKTAARKEVAYTLKEK